MSGDTFSNLKNQTCCRAKSKRTGLQCKQPKMRDKSVCRFHGGKSTGPKTSAGKERIRQAKLIHGQYSKNSKERQLTIKAIQQMKEVVKLDAITLKVLKPYLSSYQKAEVQEQFGLINLFVFGGLNQLIKTNPALRRLISEFLLLVLEKKEDRLAIRLLIDEVDHHICTQLGSHHSDYISLPLRQRRDAYVTQLIDKLYEIADALPHPSKS